MYTKEQLQIIAYYHNWGGIDQDSNGNVSWNTHQDNETGWRRATQEQISEAFAKHKADASPGALTKLTVICQHEGSTDIVVYVVEVSNPGNRNEVRNAIRVERERDLGDELVDDLYPLIAFEGDLWDRLRSDWRDDPIEG